MLREEIQLLQEPGSYVGEVVKVMGKTKVLVKVRRSTRRRSRRPPREDGPADCPSPLRLLKVCPPCSKVPVAHSSPPPLPRRQPPGLSQVHPEGKYVVDVAKDIKMESLKTGLRVALKNDSYTLHSVLPSLVDPLVSLMKAGTRGKFWWFFPRGTQDHLIVFTSSTRTQFHRMFHACA